MVYYTTFAQYLTLCACCKDKGVVLLLERMKTTSGFTIVELLIVIVVIAVLAAISIVSYTGITDRANNIAVQNDIANLARKIQAVYAETGAHPEGGGRQTSATASLSGDSRLMTNFTFSPSKNAYWASNASLHYCQGFVDGASAFRVVGRSKAGQSYEFVSTKGSVTSLGDVNLWNYSSQRISCQGLDYPWTYSYGYGNDTWNPWTL